MVSGMVYIVSIHRPWGGGVGINELKGNFIVGICFPVQKPLYPNNHGWCWTHKNFCFLQLIIDKSPNSCQCLTCKPADFRANFAIYLLIGFVLFRLKILHHVKKCSTFMVYLGKEKLASTPHMNRSKIGHSYEGY